MKIHFHGAAGDATGAAFQLTTWDASVVADCGLYQGGRQTVAKKQEVNAFVGMAFEHRTFFTRLHQFVLASDAFVVAPGGIGTVLEAMMIWQLLQVRHLTDTPLILVGRMWPGLVEWARASMLSTDPPLASPEDMSIPRCVASGDEAIAVLREYHGRWLRARAE